MLRVTVDTNVFISGLNFSGNPRRVLNLAESGAIRLAISQAILDEVTRVLRRKKFGWPENEIERALKQISRFSHRIEPGQPIDVVIDDPTDNRILECAVASESDYLVTGDTHLLNIGRYLKVKIVTPAEFLEVKGQLGGPL